MNFFIQYKAEIIQVAVILSPVIGLFIKRMISDGNLLKKFETIKALAEKVSLKELDITGAINKVNLVVEGLTGQIERIQAGVDERLTNIDQTVLAFMEGDLYQKMLSGLSQLDELSQLLQNKDTTIQQLGNVIKEIRKKLGD